MAKAERYQGVTVYPAPKAKAPKIRYQNYKCNICKAEYNNENFAVDHEKDCPVCDNRDCAIKTG